ncbi:Fe-S cluster assembly ATP-binding protein [Thermosulfidibacter takaii ABI70S6]|uniref:Fe-S cluster assembly ATP-binding protein n=1 Tax=Thermosulfidibacter takaii (strain DSM 17441 / JCM 13301 / NBRC 103674 / ABI70S6) TaxID=1298851 RepID=A0A0S3QTR3_THET7|nr:ABC transporter ATP-binding protein [Thermosulfidibacter takaii]BAT71721.1 Fe-S cluster assembly ATP-binding protein [Thermosulfidibacter takaii ABI70S6]
MLKVENLRVKVQGKDILHGIDLEVPKGKVITLMGPNGSGKTTLIMTIMGFSGYEVVDGKIWFKGIDITHLPVYERVKLGIGLAFQRPPVIKGVKTKQIVEIAANARGRQVDPYELAKEVNMMDFLERDVNDGFSGGEMKRSEILQLMAMDPDLLLLDEPESGVDLESIALLGRAINKILGREVEPRPDKSIKEVKKEYSKSALIITHTGHILNYVNADLGYVLINGRIVCSGNPRDILKTVEKYGYKECERCV